jgi:hypothetical protein
VADALIDLGWFQIAPSLQEVAKAEIFILFSLGQLADLNQINHVACLDADAHRPVCA